MLEQGVSKDFEGFRADKFVKGLCPNFGFGLLQKLFRTKRIKINGKKAVASQRLHEGDVVKIFAAPTVEASKTDSKLFDQLQNMIIFENDDFFAINKPAKLAVQLGSKINFCVETLIKAHPKHKCFLVHRLDKDTSGVLLVAKNQLWARRLTEMFRKNQIHKTYIALVDGKIKAPGVIDNFIKKCFVGNEEVMKIVDDGQRAITHYRPLCRVGHSTILELKPETGRKHQLRVHCASIDAPILGDRKYNPTAHGNMMLHAYKIFIEPLRIEIEAPIPKYFPQEPFEAK